MVSTVPLACSSSYCSYSCLFYSAGTRTVQTRVGNFRQKNYSSEDEIDGTIGLFRRNAEFRLFRGTENFRNSVPNRSAEEKNAWNSVPWNKIRGKRSEFHSEPREITRNSVPWNKNISKHLIFCSEPFRGRDNNSKFRSETRVMN